jgi:hypothetical protein
MVPFKIRGAEGSGVVGLPFLQAAKRLRTRDKGKRRTKTLDLML